MPEGRVTRRQRKIHPTQSIVIEAAADEVLGLDTVGGDYETAEYTYIRS